MKKPVLVIMAAGMGSRYGGLKQMDPVGPCGELILDYSLFDAKRAGFERAVIIIKKENEKDFREVLGDRVSRYMQIDYAYQSLDGIPEGFSIPEGRVKPWGTGHAVLSALEAVDGAPFCAINADDYYGREAYFVKSRASIRFWRKTAAYALVLWAVLYFVQPYVVALSSAETWVSHIGIALSMPANFCMMAVLVALMSLIWFSAGDGFRFQRFAIPIGRMSLTAYITQSLLGVTIFYNYGLGLYRYCGPILSAVIAAGIIAALWWTGRMWLRSHRQGPLERVWKSLTWIGSSATVEKSLNHCASK